MRRRPRDVAAHRHSEQYSNPSRNQRVGHGCHSKDFPLPGRRRDGRAKAEGGAEKRGENQKMRLIFVTLVSLFLAGCGGEEYQDLRDFVKNSRAAMRGKMQRPPRGTSFE